MTTVFFSMKQDEEDAGLTIEEDLKTEADLRRAQYWRGFAACAATILQELDTTRRVTSNRDLKRAIANRIRPADFDNIAKAHGLHPKHPRYRQKLEKHQVMSLLLYLIEDEPRTEDTEDDFEGLMDDVDDFPPTQGPAISWEKSRARDIPNDLKVNYKWPR